SAALLPQAYAKPGYPVCPTEIKPIKLIRDAYELSPDFAPSEGEPIECNYINEQGLATSARITLLPRTHNIRNADKALAQHLSLYISAQSSLEKNATLSTLCDNQIELVTHAKRYSLATLNQEDSIKNTNKAACTVFTQTLDSDAQQGSAKAITESIVVSAQQVDDWIIMVGIVSDSSEFSMEAITGGATIIHALQMQQPEWLQKLLSPFL
ncbi:MAG: hypothetical protein ACPGPF_07165, partial [Pontibacterium sp.]